MKSLFLIISLFPILSYTQIISTVAGNGTKGYSGNGGIAINAHLYYPSDIVFDKDGNMYISDENNNVVRKIDASGIISGFAGNGFGAGTLSGGYAGDGGIATAAELYSPIGLAFDTSGNLYVADEGNNVVRKIDKLGMITTIAGNGSDVFSGDGGPATSAGMAPYGIAIDQKNNIYIADGVNLRVRKINTSGIISTVAGGGTSLADGIPATDAKLVYPGLIAISPSQELYIPDWTHHKVRKVDAAGIITTIAGNGTSGNNGDGGLAVDAELEAPNSITFDEDGNFYISDDIANVVRKVNTTGIISTIAGNGTQGYSGDGGLAIEAQLDDPTGALIGPDRNLYFAEANNNIIRKVAYSSAVLNTASNRTYPVYPNPAKDHITIKAYQQITNIEISNTIGQIVYNHAFYNAKNVQLPINSWPAGIYFVRVNDAWIQKLVKE